MRGEGFEPFRHTGYFLYNPGPTKGQDISILFTIGVLLSPARLARLRYPRSDMRVSSFCELAHNCLPDICFVLENII